MKLIFSILLSFFMIFGIVAESKADVWEENRRTESKLAEEYIYRNTSFDLRKRLTRNFNNERPRFQFQSTCIVLQNDRKDVYGFKILNEDLSILICCLLN